MAKTKGLAQPKAGDWFIFDDGLLQRRQRPGGRATVHRMEYSDRSCTMKLRGESHKKLGTRLARAGFSLGKTLENFDLLQKT